MKHVCQILLLLMPLFCKSQQRTVDSLKRLLPTATTDSARYRITYYIGNSYYSIGYDSALYYVDKALVLAQKNGKKLNEASAMGFKGFLLNRLQRVPESFQALTAALQIAEDPGNKNSFWNTLKPKIKDKDYRSSVLGGIHNSLGIFMQYAGRTDQAVLHFKEGIKSYSLAGAPLAVAVMNANLGDLYLRNLNKPDSALLYEQAAESIYLGNKDERLLGYIYEEMGADYAAKHSDSLALAFFYKAISLNKKNSVLDFLAVTYRELAKFYLQKENRDSALYYSREAAKIHIAWLPMDLGDDFENLAKSYALNHQQDSAYKYQVMALATYDSLYKNRIKGLAGFQQLSFQQQQQLQQLEAAKTAAQNRRRIYTLLTGLGIILLIGFLLYRNNRQKQRTNTLLHQKNQQIESTLHELKSTQAQLIQSEKMASLGELTAGIAHEIQNPLNFINNFSEVNKELIAEMKEEIDQGNVEEVKAIANDIEENEQKINHHGKRADAIVKGMLQHSRTNTGRKEPTDINALADEYLRLSYHGLRAKDKSFNAEFKTDFDESIGKINVVSQDIGRVLLNLFNNAFYAVNEKKKAPSLKGENYEPTVWVTTKRIGLPSGAGGLEISVKDNGNGIPQNVLDKIFQPFFTTKPAGQGTGLGLSLSYDILKAHGGELKAETKEGEFAKFIIRLPFI